MKKVIVVIFAVIIFIIIPASADCNEPEITADAAILLDRDSGEILFAKRAREKRPIASTTKVLTAILAIDKGNMVDKVIVTPKAAAVGESSIYLEPNEQLTLEALLYGALMRSGNDACVAIAEHIAGDEQKFVRLMNKKALTLGAKDSHFVNTNGLPNEQHYSTAYDLALIANYALENEMFSEIVATKTRIVRNEDNPDKERFLSNTNKLLWNYEWADGVKTGTTDKAGKCLIGSATKGDRSLIIVLLHSDDRESDGKRLLEYGFNNFTTQNILKKDHKYTDIWIQKENTKLSIKAKEDLTITINNDQLDRVEKRLELNYQPVLPIEKGEKVGEFAVYLDSKKNQSVDLIATRSVEKKTKFKQIIRFLEDFR